MPARAHAIQITPSPRDREGHRHYLLLRVPGPILNDAARRATAVQHRVEGMRGVRCELGCVGYTRFVSGDDGEGSGRAQLYVWRRHRLCVSTVSCTDT